MIAAAASALALAAGGTDARASTYDFRCDSNYGQTARCAVDTKRGVSIVRQNGRVPCRFNETWGYDRSGVWVANGCKGTFRVQTAGGSSGDAATIALGIIALGIIAGAAKERHEDQPHYGRYDQPLSYVDCSSGDRRREYCRVRVPNYAEVSRQYSSAPCTYGRSWGYDRGGIWVDNGCRAQFAIH